MNIECTWALGEYAIRLNGVYLVGFSGWRAKARAFELAYRLRQALEATNATAGRCK